MSVNIIVELIATTSHGHKAVANHYGLISLEVLGLANIKKNAGSRFF